ncbi:MAG: amino acid adenylation domain-containing protein, partial [Spirochaetota bacterium]|nr:amino acid adenylation domain-containing protein [Spirochaetota bacterium]
PGSRMSISLHYYRSLFDSAMISRVLFHLEQILRVLVSDPGLSVSDVDMLTSDERERILVSFNNTAKPYPLERCVFQMIEDQATRAPDSIAVTFEDKSLTYNELNGKANQLARYLRKLGVGRETMVGMMLDRSLEMMIALLGIMKSGGAYVPIGTEYPDSRVDYILEDTLSPIVLTQERHVHRLSDRNVMSLCLDSQWEDIAKEEASNLSYLSGPEDVVYVLYTSGSTGIPKGVACIHQGLCNRLFWMQEEYPLLGDDCILQKTPYTFDVSGWEFFWALMFGARVHFLNPGMEKDPLNIINVISDREITTIHFVPSMLSGFLRIMDDENRSCLKSLRRVFCSGEALLAEHRDVFFKYIDCELHNLYGPTEASIDVTYYECSPRDKSSAIPIGRPIANMEVYILDRNMNPVPIGIAGEIYLAGLGLAEGYINKPEKTDEVFIPSAQSRYGRLYRTGDLGRWLYDGSIEYLGRIDNQVKIRGNRVELGEIEACLLSYDGIVDVVVVARDDPEGNKYLATFYVSDVEFSTSSLRSHIGENLPDYMIPSRFMLMESLPLTPNGKIDRKALPDINGLRPVMERVYAAPRDDLERVLALAWQEVLGIDKVGIYDNFFDLGGHSLLILKAIAKLKLSYPITIQDFFDYQTIADLAQKARERMETEGKESDISMTEDDTTIEIEKNRIIPISGQKENLKAVLLTGVTGYLGAHLLYELLNKTNAHVYCLIRGESKEHIIQRVLSTMDFYFNLIEVDCSRITPILGDLEIDGICLDVDDMWMLLEKVDTIVHSAADVRHYGEYSHFEKINVMGTKRLLDLARIGNCKRFHHISTLSISGDYIPNMSQIVFSELDYNRGQVLNNVYGRSKFEAESLVRDATGNGFNATIYRIGALVGDSTTGKFQRSIDTNAFYGLIKAIIQMGVVPGDSDGQLDMTPVDSCRDAIVNLMLLPETSGHTFHLYNPNLITINNLREQLSSFGYNIQSLSVEDYATAIQNALENKELEEVVQKLIPYITASFTPKTRVKYDNRISSHFLDSVGFRWPSLDRELLKRLIKYCVTTGFVKSSEI